MNDIQAAWLAGFLDGEGTFCIRRHKNHGVTVYTPTVSATSTDRSLLDQCVAIAGGNLNGPYKGSSDRARQFWTWRVGGYAVRDLCLAVLPFLVGKGRQARLLVEFAETLISRGAQPGQWGRRHDTEIHVRKERLYQAVRYLNWRGLPPPPLETIHGFEAVEKEEYCRIAVQHRLSQDALF